MTQLPAKLVIATRESALALWQARHVRERLCAAYPSMEVELLGMTTEGDQNLSTSLAKIGGKGLFIKELEQALADGRADIAVHSMKDVPVQLPEGFTLAAISAREDARDAFVSNSYAALRELPAGSVVGTSSLRRESQIRARYPALKVEPLRGNVQTRLRRLDEGRFAAIILAVAGLKRLDLAHRITAPLALEDSIPAVGQGALGIECLARNAGVVDLVRVLHDQESAVCVQIERAVSMALGGSCTLPLGVHARMQGRLAHVTGVVASPDGMQYVRAELARDVTMHSARQIGLELADKLRRQGAAPILDALKTAAAS
ncbi:MAG: hydroxymethylbilane synthase [Burkholderiales bacterium]